MDESPKAVTAPIRVAVIGYGYWGPNLVRNFSGLDDCVVTAVCDLDEVARATAGRFYPAVRIVGDVEELLASDDVDAVAIATPVSSHFPLAQQVIRSGRHVLIEKPMTTTSQQARELISLSEDAGVVLMVDHTFLYTGAVRKMRAWSGTWPRTTCRSWLISSTSVPQRCRRSATGTSDRDARRWRP